MYVIINKGRFVADQRKRAGSSYTNKLQYAKVFNTVEEAKRDKCGDESIRAINEMLSSSYQEVK